jgi:hypothetical protein
VTCPHGLEPFRVCLESGEAMPLFVPASMLDGFRKSWPRIWIEAQPDVPLLGKAITHAQWQESLKDS